MQHVEYYNSWNKPNNMADQPVIKSICSKIFIILYYFFISFAAHCALYTLNTSLLILEKWVSFSIARQFPPKAFYFWNSEIETDGWGWKKYRQYCWFYISIRFPPKNTPVDVLNGITIYWMLCNDTEWLRYLRWVRSLTHGLSSMEKRCT